MSAGMMPSPVSFAVAITGHRDIADDRAGDLERLVGDILDRCASQVRAQAGARPVMLRFLSGLAEGADQIAMRAAQARAAWRCEAVLPFARERYLATFADPVAGRAALAALIGADTQVIELGVDSPDATGGPGGFAGLGRYLVEHADLLIAVWRGRPPAGPGGTADVVACAIRAGLPVIWINPDTLEQRSLLSGSHGPGHATVGDIIAGADPGSTAAIVRSAERAVIPRA